MKRDGLYRGFLILAVALAACLAGCSDSTEGPEHTPSPYGDLTDKEHCIRNLIVSHMRREIEPYEGILHPDYTWYGKKWGLFGDMGTIITRAEDIMFTQDLFEAAVTLELDIDGGTWQEITKVGDEPCPGCWLTDRTYTIETQLSGSETILAGSGQGRFIVVPVEEGKKTKYTIRWGYDIDFY